MLKIGISARTLDAAIKRTFTVTKIAEKHGARFVGLLCNAVTPSRATVTLMLECEADQ